MKSLNLKITNTLLLVIIASVICTILWGINKGFDITDEGFAMLLYKYPQEYTFIVTTFHMLGSKLFEWLSPNIITYRLLRLILSVLSTLIFSWGFWVWLKNNDFIKNNISINFLTHTLFLILGCLSYYSLSHYIANYNAINSHLMLISTGILLFIIANHKQNDNNKKYTWLLMLLGIIIAFQFFIKFSSAILFLTLSIFLLLLYFRKVIVTLYPILGVFIGIFLYFIFIQDYQSWLLGTVESVKLTSTTDVYGPVKLLEQYFNYFSSITQHLIISFLFLFFSLFLLTRLFFIYKEYNLKKEHNVLIVVSTILYTFFIYQIYQLGLYKGSQLHTVFWEKSAHIYIVILFACLSILLAVLWNNIKQLFSLENLKILSVILLLLIEPIVGMVGTNNVSSAALSPYLTTWFALILMLVLYLSKFQEVNTLSSIILITVALLTLSKVVDGVIYSHYRLADKRINQTETIENIDLLNGIKVDIKTKHFFEELNKIIKEKTDFEKGDPILAAYDMPGIVYALGGISPGTPWYFVEKESLQKTNCAALSRSKLKNLNRTLVLIQWQMYQEFYDCMSDTFKKLGALSMTKVGETKSPYTNQMVQVFTFNYSN